MRSSKLLMTSCDCQKRLEPSVFLFRPHHTLFFFSSNGNKPPPTTDARYCGTQFFVVQRLPLPTFLPSPPSPFSTLLLLFFLSLLFLLSFYSSSCQYPLILFIHLIPKTRLTLSSSSDHFYRLSSPSHHTTSMKTP